MLTESAYPVVKGLHVGAVALSFALFFLRGVWLMMRPALLERQWVRVVPHVIDTVLLASALVLAAISGQYPFVAPWLTAKVLALLAYIGIGSLAIRRGRTRRQRLAAWVVALAIFAYIVCVAVTRDPLPWRTAFGPG